MALAVAVAPVAIVVPYMDTDPDQKRSQQLVQFLTYMPGYLSRHGVIHDIYIVEQTEGKFNRGWLLNVGFLEAQKRKEYNRIVFHDVDLLPCEKMAKEYARTRLDDSPVIHLGARWRDRYSGDAYLGGVLSVHATAFRSVNGFPNRYWGWGGEDDELRRRLDSKGVVVDRPKEGVYTDLEFMTLEQKLTYLRRKDLKCSNKWELAADSQDVWLVDGLSSTKYDVMTSAVHPLHETNVVVHLRLASPKIIP